MTWFPHRVHCETIASVPPELKEKKHRRRHTVSVWRVWKVVISGACVHIQNSLSQPRGWKVSCDPESPSWIEHCRQVVVTEVCHRNKKNKLNTNKTHARNSLISFPSFLLLEWGSREIQQSAQSIQTGCLDWQQYSFTVVIVALTQTLATRKMRWNARETTWTPAKVQRDSTAISGRWQSAQFERAPPTLSPGQWHRKSTATAPSSTPPNGQN